MVSYVSQCFIFKIRPVAGFRLRTTGQGMGAVNKNAVGACWSHGVRAKKRESQLARLRLCIVSAFRNPALKYFPGIKVRTRALWLYAITTSSSDVIG